MTASLFSRQTKALLKAALREDIGKGDITSRILISPAAKGRAVIFAREKGVLCGIPVAEELFRLVDPHLRPKFFIQEGRPFRKNKKIAEIEGPVLSLLKAERTVLNFFGHLSGIATLTRRFVERVKRDPVLVLDTRKTTPLWRELEKYAVRVGGGKNHRMGLYDAVFVKENHRPYGNLERLKKFSGKFEIEVRNIKELKEALKLHPRVILFDNFSPLNLRRGVQIARHAHPQIILEASGGITLENVVHYAAMGVDWISIGSLTHSVKSIDFSLLIK
ncbi:MAG: carboxylating nicotinate-nucleotide diphosphorylase [Candidatus Omnitrophica bacterium]|nr:carboxylating nicotinate-nucleotide diphosphorylase [Candidatus Omnitrophota bacterium]